MPRNTALRTSLLLSYLIMVLKIKSTEAKVAKKNVK